MIPRALGKTVTPLYRVQSERSPQVVNQQPLGLAPPGEAKILHPAKMYPVKM